MLLEELERHGWGGSPWRDIDRLHREMNCLFSSGFDSIPEEDFPAINVWKNDESASITAELPGVTPDSIDISILDKTLTIKGSREPEELKDGAKYHRQERNEGKFSRSIELPFRVESGKVDASFTRGVLRVALPRAEEDKPKKITVKAA